MNTLSKKNILNFFIQILPISFIIGNSAVNLNIVLVLISSVLIILKEKIKFTIEVKDYPIILFFILLISISLLKMPINNNEYIFKNFFYFRFLILFITFRLLIKNNFINLDKFFFVNLICLIIISIDIIIQSIFGFNLIGLKQFGAFNSSFFSNEAIAGSYLQNIFCFAYLFASKYKKINKFNYLLIFIIIIHFIGILLSGNRMPIFIDGLILLILFFVFKENRKEFVVSGILIAIITFAIFTTNENVNNRYKYFFRKIEQINQNINEIFDRNLQTQEEKHSSGHDIIFMHTINSFKKSIIFGNGFKSIRKNCYLDPRNDNAIPCITHPHNFTLEILNDSGLMGYLLFLSFILIIFYTFKKDKKFLNKESRSVFKIIFIFFIIKFWPLQSSGSIFSTHSATFFWLFASLLNYKKLPLNNFDKKN